MSPIASTTAMKTKPLDVFVSDFPFDSYDFSTNGVENNFDIGIVGKVFPSVKYSNKGPFVNALLWKGDIKCLLLICCGPDSDFGYKTALSLEGLPIKIPQQEDTLYVIKSFDDVIDKEARNNLRDIDAGKKEFVAGITSTGFINNAENLGEEDVPAGTTATGFIDNAENLGEEDVPAGTTVTGPINNEENLGEEDVPAGTTATGSINNEENLGEVEVHEVTNSVAHETKSDSESEYIEIKISIRKK